MMPRDHISEAIAAISRDDTRFGVSAAKQCVGYLKQFGAAVPIDHSMAANIVAIYGRELVLAVLENLQRLSADDGD